MTGGAQDATSKRAGTNETFSAVIAGSTLFAMALLAGYYYPVHGMAALGAAAFRISLATWFGMSFMKVFVVASRAKAAGSLKEVEFLFKQASRFSFIEAGIAVFFFASSYFEAGRLAGVTEALREAGAGSYVPDFKMPLLVVLFLLILCYFVRFRIRVKLKDEIRFDSAVAAALTVALLFTVYVHSVLSHSAIELSAASGGEPVAPSYSIAALINFYAAAFAAGPLAWLAFLSAPIAKACPEDDHVAAGAAAVRRAALTVAVAGAAAFAVSSVVMIVTIFARNGA